MKRKLSNLVILSWITTATFGLAAPSEPTPPRTLDDYLMISALNNAGLKSSYERWRVETLNIPQARALPDPILTYEYMIRESMETPGSRNMQRFSIMQMFPWFGTIRARTDAASAAAKAAYLRYEGDKLQLLGNIKQGFYEYAYLFEAIEIAQENLELLRHFEQIAQARYRTAAATHPDVVRARIELATMEDEVQSMLNMQTPAASEINAMLNRRTDLPLPRPQYEPAAPVRVREDAIVRLIADQNPELLALEKDIQAARHSIELAGKRYYPDIGLGIEIEDVPGARNSVMAMVSLNLPIWRESYRAAENQARAQMRMTRRQREQQEADLAARAARLLYDIQETHRRANLYGNVLVPMAREMVTVSEASYRIGEVDFLTLIDAQRTLLTFKITHQRIVTDHSQRLAELEVLTGGELPIIEAAAP
jgi:outer membrane protein TolC